MRGRLIYDQYCVPPQMDNSKYKIESIATIGSIRRELDPASPNIAYNTDPIPLYKPLGSQKLAIRVDAMPGSDYVLAYWIDWDENGQLEDTERSLLPKDPFGTYVFRPTIPSGTKAGPKRMRIAVGQEAKLSSACMENGLTEGVVRDEILDLKEESLYPDLELTAISIPQYGLNRSATEKLSISLKNTSAISYDKELKVSISVDGKEQVETIDCSTSPLAGNSSAVHPFVLKTDVDLSAIGAHTITVRIAEQPAEQNPQNNTLPALVVYNTIPAKSGKYALAFQSQGANAQKEFVSLQNTEVGMGLENISTEFWVKLDHSQYAMLVEGDGQKILSSYKMNAKYGIPDNSLAVVMGTDGIAYTDENTLMPEV